MFSNFAKNSFAINEDKSVSLFNMQYKSFFIGTIVEDSGNKFKIKIEQVFMGENLDIIEVDKFYKYSYSSLVPQKDDHLVAILNMDDTLDLDWIFKATSTNYKSLYLANDLEPENAEVKVFQHLINEGEYFLKQEEIDANKKKDESKKTVRNEIKPKSDSEKLAEIDKKDNEEFEKKMETVYKYFKNPVLLIVPAILFLLIFYTLGSRKKFRKEVEEDDENDFR